MNSKFKYLTALVAFLGASFAAQAVTQAEVDEARNECRQHKLLVQDKGSFARDEEKRAWEEACGHATALMDELAGKAPTAVAATPPAEPAAAGEAAAFEAPAGTASAYHYFTRENLKRQAAGGMTAAMEAPQAPTEQAPSSSAPDEAVLEPSSPPAGPPQEDEAEEEAPYIPPGP